MLSKSRQKTKLNCIKCDIDMYIRNDYLKNHSGICMSCQKQNNKNALKHGDYKDRLYKIWLGLNHRRYNSYNPKRCNEWDDYNNFKEWSLNNGYKEYLTIDRIDNKKDYKPNNCQWVSLKINAGKDKIIFKKEDYGKIYEQRKKENLTQIEYAKKIGVSRNTIQRIEKSIKTNK
jgi:DNA-binding XRE family transcriptional regulator